MWHYRRRTRPLPHELLNSLTLLLWGIWLAAPWETFGATPVFSSLSVVLESTAVSETWFGVAGAGLGLVSLVIMLRGPVLERALCSLLRFGFWAAVWVLLILGEWRSTATIIYGTLTFGAAWAFLELVLAHGS